MIRGPQESGPSVRDRQSVGTLAKYERYMASIVEDCADAIGGAAIFPANYASCQAGLLIKNDQQAKV
jgi:hypothetical protein